MIERNKSHNICVIDSDAHQEIIKQKLKSSIESNKFEEDFIGVSCKRTVSETQGFSHSAVS